METSPPSGHPSFPGLTVGTTRLLLLTGPSGSGKTTVGRRVAADLGWPFYDADDYHPKGNISKMAQGMSLNDQDRLPWLRALHDLIAGILSSPTGRSHGVLACSALKQSYRDLLKNPERKSPDGNGIGLVYLKAPRVLLETRLKARTGHFFKSDLLSTQLEILEEPEDALFLDANLEPEVLSEAIRRTFRLSASTPAPADRPPGFGGKAGPDLS